jgi:hypothetical protein
LSARARRLGAHNAGSIASQNAASSLQWLISRSDVIVIQRFGPSEQRGSRARRTWRTTRFSWGISSSAPRLVHPLMARLRSLRRRWSSYASARPPIRSWLWAIQKPDVRSNSAIGLQGYRPGPVLSASLSMLLSLAPSHDCPSNTGDKLQNATQ